MEGPSPGTFRRSIWSQYQLSLAHHREHRRPRYTFGWVRCTAIIHIHPLTIRSAKKTASLFPGSALLTYNTVGHTSVAASSTCIYGYMREYFRDGTLPPPGTICQPDETLFNSTATAGVLRRDSLVGMGTGFGKRMRPFYP
ncbi:hypothetical protein C8F01DRAFT_989451 [Mycena amicta]|nr:hypothetical protein C8F01DRAFT_989451 [Mycena amicta]